MKNLVAQVPFVTSPGWIPEAKGTRNGGPDTIITNLCVFKFNRGDGIIHLESLHPGSSIDLIKDQTGFPFKIPRKIITTAPPTAREKEVITKLVDPEGIRKLLLQPPK